MQQPHHHHKRTPSARSFAEEISFEIIFRSYRIGFSRSHTGRYLPSSKRRISWSFGLANLEAIKYGCEGHDCRGTENEVVVVWSIRSGKTRLWWNNSDVTHLVPCERGHTSGASCDADLDLSSGTNTTTSPIMFVEFSWRCGTGQMIRIRCHSNPPPDGSRQYELFIDGQPFSSLPTISDLGSQEYVNRHLAKRQNKLFNEFRTRSERSYNDDEVGSSYSSSRNRRYVEGERPRAGVQSNLHDVHHPRLGHVRNESSDSRQLRDRLAKAGLSVQQDQEVVDELTLQSDYSSSLKTIRDDLIGTLPELEDVMSFAIINAFTEEEIGREDDDWADDSRSKISSGSRTATMSGMIIETPPTDPTGIEVDALCDAYDWMAAKRNASPGTNGDHIKNQVLFQSERRTFLQDMVTHTIASVRHGYVSALEASHIIQGVATVLGMKLLSPLPRDTILFTKLYPDTSSESLRKQMEGYGDIDAAGVASSGRGFGMCRFKSVDDAKSAYEAESRGEIEIDGTRPTIFEIHHPAYPPPVSHVSTDCDLPDLITPDTTWESSEEGIEVDDLSYIHLPDPLNSSSHSCELPAVTNEDEDDNDDDDDYSAPRIMLETYSGTTSPNSTHHHRKRSTAIFDGEPKTYEDTGDGLFQQLHQQRQPTSGVCELQDPSFAEIYRQEQLKYKSENATVHVLCGVPDEQ